MKEKYIAIAILSLLNSKIYSQEMKWHRQPVQMETRWAKQVSPTNTHNEYPRPQFVRKKWTNLNGLWDYAITEKDGSQPNKYGGKILVPYPIESSLSGVKTPLLPTQNLWYKRSFEVSDLKKEERILLHFGAVDWQTTVFVNGKEIGGHTGGYTGFTLDITDALKDGSNELTVKVYDPTDQGIGPHGKQVLHPENIYYTASSGIWQTVWMETVPRVSIADLKMTPDIDKGVLNLNVNTSFPTRGGSPQGGERSYRVKITASAAGTIVASKTGAAGAALQLSIKNSHLWSPADPFLYDLQITLLKDGKVIDQVKSYFGMRKIAIAKDEKGVDRIFLNNKPYFNLGTLDQGFWPDGLYTAPTDEALAFDIKAIKTMGFNTIRKHIKVEPARWYYWADKLGILVWQDMVNPNQGLPEGSKPEFEMEMHGEISQLHNYPSIICWVLFNEKWGQYDQERLTRELKQADPSRIVNGHTGEFLFVDGKLRSPSPNAYVNSDITDVHAYPDPMMPLKQLGKAQVCGEFGGIGISVPYHEWNDLKGWGYINVPPSEFEKKYSNIINKLQQLKEQGLSGSIYTQPFDVEGEENGIMTYDREIIKIPIEKLKFLNNRLSDIKFFNENAQTVITCKNIDLDDNDTKFPMLLNKFNKGKNDSAFLRRLTLMALRIKDQDNATKVGNAFVDKLVNKFSQENLVFIRKITRTSDDRGFEIFQKKTSIVDSVLGPNESINKVRDIIYKEEIVPYIKGPNPQPDWEQMFKRLKLKYGLIGEEKFYGARMLYSWENEDWENFGKYYSLYYTTAYKRSEFHINNLSWSVFEHIRDPNVLNVAINTMKYSIENFDKDDYHAYDTYANLLYKNGQKHEALQVEEKAFLLSSYDSEIAETLNKMKSEKQTWK